MGRTKANASEATAPRRLLQIDFLRGVAVLMVMGAHAGQLPVRGSLLEPLTGWLEHGACGVDLFFGLSGFLVGGLLFSELRATGRMSVARFIVRRGFKIWPSYYAFLAFYFVYLRFTYHLGGGEIGRLLTPNLVHLQNYWSASPADGAERLQYWGFNLRHTWSLAVEEHFYLALPLFLLLVSPPARLRLFVPAMAALLAVACLVLRFERLSAGDLVGRPIIESHLRIDSLFLGVALAYVYHFHRSRFDAVARRPLLLGSVGFGIVVASQMTGDDTFERTIGYLMLAVGAACLIAALMAPRDPSAVRSFFEGRVARAISFVGVYSYSIYLWHLSLGIYVTKAWLKVVPLAASADLRWLLAMASYVGIGVGTGVVLGRVIEYPALALRDRLFPSRTAALPQKSGETIEAA